MAADTCVICHDGRLKWTSTFVDNRGTNSIIGLIPGDQTRDATIGARAIPCIVPDPVENGINAAS